MLRFRSVSASEINLYTSFHVILMILCILSVKFLIAIKYLILNTHICIFCQIQKYLLTFEICYPKTHTTRPPTHLPVVCPSHFTALKAPDLCGASLPQHYIPYRSNSLSHIRLSTFWMPMAFVTQCFLNPISL